MAPTPSATSKTTGRKDNPNKNSNDDYDFNALGEKQPSKKRSLVRTPSFKSVSTRSSASSIKSTTSNTSQSFKVNGGKKQSSKRRKVNVPGGTKKRSPVRIEQKIMGQNQSQAETEREEKSDEKNQLETTDIVTIISESSSEDQINTGKDIIFDQKLNKSRVVLTGIDVSTVSSGSDNMKPKHSKRKTPEDGFGDITVMAKRTKVSRKSERNSPQRTEADSSLSDDLGIEENDPFDNAMKELANVDYGLELGDSLLTDLELLDPFASIADLQAECSIFEYQNDAAENPTHDTKMIKHDNQGTSNMNTSFDVAQPTNRDEPNFENDSEDDEMHSEDGHESDGEANKQNGQCQNEIETNGGLSSFDHSENGDSDDDAISIMDHYENDPFFEGDMTENTQSKGQMQVPRWKNQQPTKTNEVPKLIPGPVPVKGTPVQMKSPRTISQPLTSATSFEMRNIAIAPCTQKITNNLPLTPSSRDPREQKRLMLAKKQNMIPNGQLSVASQMSQPSTSSTMKPPAAPPRKSVKDRLGLKDKNVNVIRNINTTKNIPCLMSIETNHIPNLPSFLPRDEPKGEVLPELDADNIPPVAKAPESPPPIPRVNVKESLVLPAFYQSPEQYRPVFGYLFNKVCRPFMSDDCKKNPNRCQFDHRLLDVDLFGSLIEKMLFDDILQTYETFMLRAPKLFDTYFEVLASYFAKKKRRDVLKRMIIDCDNRFKQHFFPHIVKCFMEMGDSYPKSLAGLIQTIKQRTTKTSHTIVKMILDGRNTNIKAFFNVLHRISEQRSYRYSIDHANRLLRIFDETKSDELAATIWKITEDTKLPKLLDQEYLRKFAEHYKK